MMYSSTYPAKVLLFGEYAILRSGASLALPFGKYSGRWVEQPTPNPHQEQLLRWADYLEAKQAEGLLRHKYRLTAFRQMLGKQPALHFQSNIPTGYGLGSSGALCAAFYDTFASREQKTNNSPLQIREELAILESFFHGQSSGMDPLISLLQQPVLREENGILRLLQPPPTALLRRFSLLNSGQTRKTGPLVQLFLKKCLSSSFLQALERQFLPATRQAIDALLKGDQKHLAKAVTAISLFQWQHLREMIPQNLHDLWETSLAENEYRLKLCGAGGGGFFLAYSLSDDKTPESAITLI